MPERGGEEIGGAGREALLRAGERDLVWEKAVRRGQKGLEDDPRAGRRRGLQASAAPGAPRIPLPFLERSDFATLALSVYLRFLSRNKRPIAKSSSASGHPSVSMECMKKPFRGVGRRLNGKGIAKQPSLGASQRPLVA